MLWFYSFWFTLEMAVRVFNWGSIIHLNSFFFYLFFELHFLKVFFVLILLKKVLYLFLFSIFGILFAINRKETKGLSIWFFYFRLFKSALHFTPEEQLLEQEISPTIREASFCSTSQISHFNRNMSAKKDWYARFRWLIQ